MWDKYVGPERIDELVVLGSMPACGKSTFRKNLEGPILAKAPSELKSVLRNSDHIQEDDLREYPGRHFARLVLEVDFSTQFPKLNKGHYDANVRLNALNCTDCLFALILWAPQKVMLSRYVERYMRRRNQEAPLAPYSCELLDRIEKDDDRRHLVPMYRNRQQRDLLASHYNEWIYFVCGHEPNGCWIVDTTHNPFEFVPVDEWGRSHFSQ